MPNREANHTLQKYSEHDDFFLNFSHTFFSVKSTVKVIECWDDLFTLNTAGQNILKTDKRS